METKQTLEEAARDYIKGDDLSTFSQRAFFIADAKWQQKQSNEMVTAVEWLEAKLSTLDDWCFIEEWTIKAKAMEKEQIEESFKNGRLPVLFGSFKAEDYYNETYGK